MRWIVNQLCLRVEPDPSISDPRDVKEVKPAAKVSKVVAAHVVSHNHLVKPFGQVRLLCLIWLLCIRSQTRLGVAKVDIPTRVVEEEPIVDKGVLLWT